MTAPHILNPAALLEKGLSEASPDLMRHLLSTVINALLSAEADAVCGAEYGVSIGGPGELPQRLPAPGAGHPDRDPRRGDPEAAAGLLLPRVAAGAPQAGRAALISVVATCYLLGVSTRRMDKLVQTLGITSLIKSQVSRMAEDLDEQVAAFRTRPLGEAGPFTFVAADALTMKVREHGRVVNAVVLVATGVNADGHREVLGVKVTTSETKEAWNTFLADLVARGLTGGQAGHPRRPRRPGRGDRGEPARRGLAALSDPLCRPPDYADVVADAVAGRGFCAGQVGIIRWAV